MAFLKKQDIVLIDQLSFENFMNYREKHNLGSSWDWMSLPSGTMMEVKGLIFRTTGRRRYQKIATEDGQEEMRYKRAKSCWVKCSIVTPMHLTGEEHIIPSWLLRQAVINVIPSEASA